jgi:hypothetical protein
MLLTPKKTKIFKEVTFTRHKIKVINLKKKRVLFKMKIIRDKTVIFKKTAKFNGILEMQIQR